MSRYLYLDDAEPHQLEPFIERINGLTGSLSIELRKPRRFDEQAEDLETFNSFDGLILDLLLHQTANEQGEKANYRGTTLAQHLRTLGTEGTLKEFPIVLWSDASKLDKAYNSDASAHDLFDITCRKEALEEKSARDHIARQLESLVVGYTHVLQICKRLRKDVLVRSLRCEDPNRPAQPQST